MEVRKIGSKSILLTDTHHYGALSPDENYKWTFRPGSTGVKVEISRNKRKLVETHLSKTDLETLLANFK